MITTNNKKLYDKMTAYKNFGRSKDSQKINFLGSNYKISEFTALFGLLELERLKKRIKKRNQIVNRYIKNLKNNKNYEIILQKNGNCSHYKCIIKTKIKAKIIEKYCRKNNINLTGQVWKIPLHKQKVFSNYVKKEKFKNADHFSKYHICPPNYPELTFKEIDYVSSILNKI